MSIPQRANTLADEKFDAIVGVVTGDRMRNRIRAGLVLAWALAAAPTAA